MRNYIDIITEEKQNRQLIESFQHAGKLITEAQLTADQINQIFAGIEKNLTAAGGNRTAIGKGVDTAKSAAGAVSQAYNGLIDKFSNTKVMQGFDAAYDKAAEQLKQATGGDQGAMQYIQKYRDFAKKHPVAQSAIYALLIAAVSIGSGGAAAPAALGLLKMGDRLLQGDKFSQALAKGATTGAAAAVGQGIKGAISGTDAVPQQKLVRGLSTSVKDIEGDGSSFSRVDDTPGVTQAAKDKMYQAMGNKGPAPELHQAGDMTGAAPTGITAVPAELKGDPQMSKAWQSMIQRIQDDVGSNKTQLQSVIQKAMNDAGIEGVQRTRAQSALSLLAQKASGGNIPDFIAAVKKTAGAGQFESRVIKAATYNFEWIALPQSLMIDYKKSWQPDYLGESSSISGVVLTREGIDCVFSNLERLHEHLLEAESEYGQEIKKPGIFGRLGAGIKQAAGAVAGSKVGQAVGQAVGKGVQAVKTAATNATTAVTADKLNKAWQAAGSPSDTDQLHDFLTKQGVDKSVIAVTFKSLGIPVTASGSQPQQGFKKTIPQPQAQPQQSQQGFKRTLPQQPQTQQPAPGTKWQPAWKKKAAAPVTRTTTAQVR